MKHEIKNLIETKQIDILKKELEEMNCQDISSLFDELTNEEVIITYRLLSKEKAIDTFSYMETETQEALIYAIADNDLSDIVNELFMDDAVDLIEEMPSNVVKRILKNIKPEKRKIINELLKYPSGSAGSIMTTEFTDLKDYMSVEEAFSRIKKIGIDSETIYTLYVLDESRKLIGVITAKSLLLADKKDLIKDIMQKNIITVNTLDDQEDVSNLMRKYDLLAMPVVDSENRLVGIITIDDIVDIIQDEATEDFEKMAAIAPSKDSYFKTSIFKHAKNRISWLIFLMFSAVITGEIISRYETAFITMPILIAFIPLLMDTAGNCGSQTSTLIIRGLAVNEINNKDIWRILWKEIRISSIVGLTLAILNSLRVFIQYNDMLLATVLGITIIGTVIVAKSLGCILPLIAKRLRLDPAVMASPLITTIADVLAVLLYFNIAVLILNLS